MGCSTTGGRSVGHHRGVSFSFVKSEIGLRSHHYFVAVSGGSVGEGSTGPAGNDNDVGCNAYDLVLFFDFQTFFSSLFLSYLSLLSANAAFLLLFFFLSLIIIR